MVQTALVTGGGAGMGKAIALRMAREGRRVGVLDHNGADAASTAAAIVAAGGEALAVTADIANRGQVETAVAQVRETLGPITVLINNAAVEHFSAFADIGEPDWDRLMGINLKGTWQVTQVVLPDMEAAGWGRIVNLSAFGAQIGAPGMVHYTASKGGVIAMTR